MECQTKFGNTNVWEYFTDMFDFMPIACLIDNKLLCLHGGLSPSIETLNEIEELDWFQEIPREGSFADLMWSDPDTDNQGFTLSSR
jgi:serine/threonine-protein phosphatase PPG1